MNLAGKGGRASVSLGRSTPLLAVLLLLLAGWFGWSAYDQWRDAGTATELEQRRDQVVAGLQKTLLAQTTELAQRLQLEPVKAALAEGNADAAAAAIADGWPGVETVQVLDAALDEAYRDPAAFGYSRLALLETAAQDSAPVAHVIRDDGSTRFGLAAAVQLGPRPALVYVRQPLSRLTAVFDQIRTPDGAYLALRQSNHTVIERGASSLGKGAEALARPVAKSSLRVSAAVPDIEPGPLGLGTIGCAVVAVLLLLIALLAVLGKGRVRMPKRLQRGESVDTGPTLRESLQQEPPPSTTVANDAAAATEPAAVPAGRQVPATIFRAYDIRGVVERDLDAEVAELIGQAIGSAMQEQGLRDVVVGRDGRLSGPQLSAGLIEGLRRAGCEVIDIGLAPTPVVYYASYHLRAGSCVAVTGSHNPADHNGFKIVIGGQTLSGEAITDLHARISDGRLHTAAEPGGLQSREVIADYIQRIADDVQLDRPLKVVADAGNGVAGAVVQPLLEAIGAEVIALHCDVDGTFPNHHPDPSEPHNLEDLIQTVKRFDADLGIAFDGDGDRLGVVTGQGQIIYPDRLLMLFAGDVLQRNPGALVIYDVKCTGKLSDYVLRHGGSPMMWKTGHSLIKAKMRETDAELAGEMSGHFFFKERWYGFDDGLYAAARLLEILGQRDESPSEVLAELPESVATPEIKVAVAEGSAHAEVARFVSAAQDDDSGFFGARLSMIDGLRADFADGWGLVRASNTTSVLVLRFEADDAAALERIKALFRTQLQALLPELQPGF